VGSVCVIPNTVVQTPYWSERGRSFVIFLVFDSGLCRITLVLSLVELSDVQFYPRPEVCCARVYSIAQGTGQL